MKRHTMHALVALNVLLAGILVWLWVAPDGRLRDVTWTSPAAVKPDFSSAPRASSGTGQTDMALVMATLDRPLFSPTRRPPPPVVAASAGAEPPPDPLRNVSIQGVYSGAGAGGIIAKVDGVSKRILLNEKIGDWTLSSIDERDVKFVRNEESRVMQLFRARPLSSQAPAGSAPSTGRATFSAVSRSDRVGGVARQGMFEAQRERQRLRREAQAAKNAGRQTPAAP